MTTSCRVTGSTGLVELQGGAGGGQHEGGWAGDAVGIGVATGITHACSS